MATSELDSLQERIGYRFRNPEWLRLALARPAARGSEGITDEDIAESEHLSWLGDSILYMVISRKLLSLRPAATKEQLTDWRKAIVNAVTLGGVAERLQVQYAVPVADGLRNDPQPKDWHHMLSDALEGIFGAVYQDGGLQDAEAAILRIVKEKLAQTVGSG